MNKRSVSRIRTAEVLVISALTISHRAGWGRFYLPSSFFLAWVNVIDGECAMGVIIFLDFKKIWQYNTKWGLNENSVRSFISMCLCMCAYVCVFSHWLQLWQILISECVKHVLKMLLAKWILSRKQLADWWGSINHASVERRPSRRLSWRRGIGLCVCVCKRERERAREKL
jgi:hypothetical protein